MALVSKRLVFFSLLLAVFFIATAQEGGLSGAGGCSCEKGVEESSSVATSEGERRRETVPVPEGPKVEPSVGVICKIDGDCIGVHACVAGRCTEPCSGLGLSCPAAGTSCTSDGDHGGVCCPTGKTYDRSKSACSDGSGPTCAGGVSTRSTCACGSPATLCKVGDSCDIKAGLCGSRIKPESCKTTADCSGGKVCDAGKKLCVIPPPPPPPPPTKLILAGDEVEGALIEYTTTLGRWNGSFKDLGKGNYSGVLYDLDLVGGGEARGRIVSDLTTKNLETPLKSAVTVTTKPTQFKKITIPGSTGPVVKEILIRQRNIYSDNPFVRAIAHLTDNNGVPAAAGTKATFTMTPSVGSPIKQEVSSKEGGLFEANLEINGSYFTDQMATLSVSSGAVSSTMPEIVSFVKPAASLVLGDGEAGIILPQRPIFQEMGFSIPIELNRSQGGTKQKITFFQFEIDYDADKVETPSTDFVTINPSLAVLFDSLVVSTPSATGCRDLGLSCISFSATAKDTVGGADPGSATRLVDLSFTLKKTASGEVPFKGWKVSLLRPGTTTEEKRLGIQNQPLRVADHEGTGSDTSGTVRSLSPQLLGIFAWATDPDLIDVSLVNSSLAGRGLLENRGIMSDDRPLSSVSDVTWTSSKPDVVGLTGSSCASVGNGTSHLTLNKDSFKVDGILIKSQKLAASDIKMEAENPELHLIEGSTSIYQRTRVTAKWTVPEHKAPDGSTPLILDLTPWIGWTAGGDLVLDTIHKGWVSTKGSGGTIGALGRSVPIKTSTAPVKISTVSVSIPASTAMTSPDASVDAGLGSSLISSKVTNGMRSFDDRAPVLVWVTTGDGKKFLAGGDAQLSLKKGDKERVVCLFDKSKSEDCLPVDAKIPGDKGKVKVVGPGEALVTANYAGRESKGKVMVEMPKTSGLAIGGTNRLARNKTDPAAKVLGLNNETQLNATVRFEGGGPAYDATRDTERTTYAAADSSVRSGSGPLATVSSTGLVQATNKGTGKVTMTVTVKGLGSELRQTFEIWVMSLESLRIDTFEDFDPPAGFTSFTPAGTTDKIPDTTFSKIESTTTYQNGRLEIHGVWTDGSEIDLLNFLPPLTAPLAFTYSGSGLPVDTSAPLFRIVPAAAGSFDITASFTGVGRESKEKINTKKTVTVTNSPAKIAMLHLKGTGTLPGMKDDDTLFHNTFSGIKGNGETRIQVVARFDDMTRRNITPSAGTTKIDGLLTFSRKNLDFPVSTGPSGDAYVSWLGVPTTGSLQIQGNGGIELTVKVASPAFSPATGQKYNLATNLSPDVGDVDIGCDSGRFVPIKPLNCAGSKPTSYLPVRIHTGDKRLASFQIEINYDTSVLTTSKALVSPGSAPGIGLTPNVETIASTDPEKTGKILLVGTFKAGDEPNGLLEVARIRFNALKTTKKITHLTGRIVSLSDPMGVAIGGTLPRFIVAGDGWVDPGVRGDYNEDGKFEAYDVFLFQKDLLTAGKTPKFKEGDFGDWSQTGVSGDPVNVVSGRQLLANLFYWVDLTHTPTTGQSILSAKLTRADGSLVKIHSRIQFDVSFGGMTGQPADKKLTVTAPSGESYKTPPITGITYNGLMQVATKLIVLDTATDAVNNESYIQTKRYPVLGTSGERSCTEDTTCGSLLKCVGGLCKPPDSPCTASLGCTASEKCDTATRSCVSACEGLVCPVPGTSCTPDGKHGGVCCTTGTTYLSTSYACSDSSAPTCPTGGAATTTCTCSGGGSAISCKIGEWCDAIDGKCLTSPPVTKVCEAGTTVKEDCRCGGTSGTVCSTGSTCDPVAKSCIKPLSLLGEAVWGADVFFANNKVGDKTPEGIDPFGELTKLVLDQHFSTPASDGSYVSDLIDLTQSGTGSVTASVKAGGPSAARGYTAKREPKSIRLVPARGTLYAGIGSIPVIAQVLDQQGQPVGEGVDVTFSTPATGVTLTPSTGKTDRNGFARTSFTADSTLFTAAGSFTLAAATGTVTQTTTVMKVAAPAKSVCSGASNCVWAEWPLGEVLTGSEFDVPVLLKRDRIIDNFSITITYDATHLSLVSIDKGLKNFTSTSDPDTKHFVAMTAYDLALPAGSSRLTTIRFKVLKAGSTAPSGTVHSLYATGSEFLSGVPFYTYHAGGTSLTSATVNSRVPNPRALFGWAVNPTLFDFTPVGGTAQTTGFVAKLFNESGGEPTDVTGYTPATATPSAAVPVTLGHTSCSSGCSSPTVTISSLKPTTLEIRVDDKTLSKVENLPGTPYQDSPYHVVATMKDGSGIDLTDSIPLTSASPSITIDSARHIIRGVAKGSATLSAGTAPPVSVQVSVTPAIKATALHLAVPASIGLAMDKTAVTEGTTKSHLTANVRSVFTTIPETRPIKVQALFAGTGEAPLDLTARIGSGITVTPATAGIVTVDTTAKTMTSRGPTAPGGLIVTATLDGSSPLLSGTTRVDVVPPEGEIVIRKASDSSVISGNIKLALTNNDISHDLRGYNEEEVYQTFTKFKGGAETLIQDPAAFKIAPAGLYYDKVFNATTGNLTLQSLKKTGGAAKLTIGPVMGLKRDVTVDVVTLDRFEATTRAPYPESTSAPEKKTLHQIEKKTGSYQWVRLWAYADLTDGDKVDLFPFEGKSTFAFSVTGNAEFKPKSMGFIRGKATGKATIQIVHYSHPTKTLNLNDFLTIDNTEADITGFDIDSVDFQPGTSAVDPKTDRTLSPVIHDATAIDSKKMRIVATYDDLSQAMLVRDDDKTIEVPGLLATTSTNIPALDSKYSGYKEEFTIGSHLDLSEIGNKMTLNPKKNGAVQIKTEVATVSKSGADAMGTRRVAINLEPDLGDVDLGPQSGVALYDRASTSADIPVRIRMKGRKLKNFELKIYFDNRVLKIADYTKPSDSVLVGADIASGYSFTPTAHEVDPDGSGLGRISISVFSTGGEVAKDTVEVAKLRLLPVKTSRHVTPITAKLIALQDTTGNIGTLPRNILAGAGDLDPPPPGKRGDLDGNSVFNVSDIQKIQDAIVTGTAGTLPLYDADHFPDKRVDSNDTSIGAKITGDFAYFTDVSSTSAAGTVTLATTLTDKGGGAVNGAQVSVVYDLSKSSGISGLPSGDQTATTTGDGKFTKTLTGISGGGSLKVRVKVSGKNSGRVIWTENYLGPNPILILECEAGFCKPSGGPCTTSSECLSWEKCDTVATPKKCVPACTGFITCPSGTSCTPDGGHGGVCCAGGKTYSAKDSACADGLTPLCPVGGAPITTDCACGSVTGEVCAPGTSCISSTGKCATPLAAGTPYFVGLPSEVTWVTGEPGTVTFRAEDHDGPKAPGITMTETFSGTPSFKVNNTGNFKAEVFTGAPIPTTKITLRWTPPLADKGDYNLTFEASDTAGHKTSQKMILHIIKDPGAAGDPVVGAKVDFGATPPEFGRWDGRWWSQETGTPGDYLGTFGGLFRTGSFDLFGGIVGSKFQEGSVATIKGQKKVSITNDIKNVALIAGTPEVFQESAGASGTARIFAFATDSLGRGYNTGDGKLVVRDTGGTEYTLNRITTDEAGFYYGDPVIAGDKFTASSGTDYALTLKTPSLTPAPSVTPKLFQYAPQPALTTGYLRLEIPQRKFAPAESFDVPLYVNTGITTGSTTTYNPLASYTLAVTHDARLELVDAGGFKITAASGMASIGNDTFSAGPTGFTFTGTSEPTSTTPVSGTHQLVATLHFQVKKDATVTSPLEVTFGGSIATLQAKVGSGFENLAGVGQPLSLSDYTGSTTGKLRLIPDAIQGLFAFATKPVLMHATSGKDPLASETGTLETRTVFYSSRDNLLKTSPTGVTYFSSAAGTVAFTGSSYSAASSGTADLTAKVGSIESNKANVQAIKPAAGQFYIELGDTTLSLIKNGEGKFQSTDARLIWKVPGVTGLAFDMTGRVKEFKVSGTTDGIILTTSTEGRITVTSATKAGSATIEAWGINLAGADYKIASRSIEVKTDEKLVNDLIVAVPAWLGMTTDPTPKLPDGTVQAKVKATNVFTKYGREVPLTIWADFGETVDHDGNATTPVIKSRMRIQGSDLSSLTVDTTLLTVLETKEKLKAISACGGTAGCSTNVTAKYAAFEKKTSVRIAIAAPAVSIDGATLLSRSDSDLSRTLYAPPLPSSTTLKIINNETKTDITSHFEFSIDPPTTGPAIATVNKDLGQVTANASGPGGMVKVKIHNKDGFLGIKDMEHPITVVTLDKLEPQVFEDYDPGLAPSYNKADDGEFKPGYVRTEDKLQLIEDLTIPTGFQRARLVLKGTWNNGVVVYLDNTSGLGADLVITKPAAFTLTPVVKDDASSWPGSWRVTTEAPTSVPFNVTLSATGGKVAKPFGPLPINLTAVADKITIDTLDVRGRQGIDNKIVGTEFDATFGAETVATADLWVRANLADGTRFVLVDNNRQEFAASSGKFVNLALSEIPFSSHPVTPPPPPSAGIVPDGRMTIKANGAVKTTLTLAADSKTTPTTKEYKLAMNLLPTPDGDVDIGSEKGRFIPVLGPSGSMIPIRVNVGANRFSISNIEIRYDPRVLLFDTKSFAPSSGFSWIPKNEPTTVEAMTAPYSTCPSTPCEAKFIVTAKYEGASGTEPTGIVNLGSINLIGRKGGSGFARLTGTVTTSVFKTDGSPAELKPAKMTAGEGWVDPPGLKNYDGSSDNKHSPNDVAQLLKDINAPGAGGRSTRKVAGSEELLGDYNGDGDANATDALLGLQILSNWFYFHDVTVAPSLPPTPGTHLLRLKVLNKDNVEVKDGLTVTAKVASATSGNTILFGIAPGTTSAMMTFNATTNSFETPVTVKFNDKIKFDFAMNVAVGGKKGNNETSVYRLEKLTGTDGPLVGTGCDSGADCAGGTTRMYCDATTKKCKERIKCDVAGFTGCPGGALCGPDGYCLGGGACKKSGDCSPLEECKIEAGKTDGTCSACGVGSKVKPGESTCSSCTPEDDSCIGSCPSGLVYVAGKGCTVPSCASGTKDDQWDPDDKDFNLEKIKPWLVPGSMPGTTRLYFVSPGGTDGTTEFPATWTLNRPGKTIKKAVEETAKFTTSSMCVAIGESSTPCKAYIVVLQGEYKEENIPLPPHTRILGGFRLDGACLKREVKKAPAKKEWTTKVVGKECKGDGVFKIDGTGGPAIDKNALIDGLSVYPDDPPDVTEGRKCRGIVIKRASPTISQNQVVGIVTKAGKAEDNAVGIEIGDDASPIIQNNEIYGACGAISSKCFGPGSGGTRVGGSIAVSVISTTPTKTFSPTIRDNRTVDGGYAVEKSGGMAIIDNSNPARLGISATGNTLKGGSAKATYGIDFNAIKFDPKKLPLPRIVIHRNTIWGVGISSEDFTGIEWNTQGSPPTFWDGKYKAIGYDDQMPQVISTNVIGVDQEMNLCYGIVHKGGDVSIFQNTIDVPCKKENSTAISLKYDQMFWSPSWKMNITKSYAPTIFNNILSTIERPLDCVREIYRPENIAKNLFLTSKTTTGEMLCLQEALDKGWLNAKKVGPDSVFEEWTEKNYYLKTGSVAVDGAKGEWTEGYSPLIGGPLLDRIGTEWPYPYDVNDLGACERIKGPGGLTFTGPCPADIMPPSAPTTPSTPSSGGFSPGDAPIPSGGASPSGPAGGSSSPSPGGPAPSAPSSPSLPSDTLTPSTTTAPSSPDTFSPMLAPSTDSLSPTLTPSGDSLGPSVAPEAPVVPVEPAPGP